jgi:hypothetical protein
VSHVSLGLDRQSTSFKIDGVRQSVRVRVRVIWFKGAFDVVGISNAYTLQ